MNKLIVLAVCVLAVTTAVNAAATKFTTKYDNVNIDEILGNERLLHNYENCILDKGKCSPDGAELRKAIPEAILNECAACSEKQREGAKKIVKFLHDKKPEIWEAILQKYDPRGTLREKYKGETDKFFAERK